MRQILTFAVLILLGVAMISADTCGEDPQAGDLPIHEYYIINGDGGGRIIHFTRDNNVFYGVSGGDSYTYIGRWDINGDTLFIAADISVKSSIKDVLCGENNTKESADPNVCALKIADYGKYLRFFEPTEFEAVYYPKNYCLFSKKLTDSPAYPWVRIHYPIAMMTDRFQVVAKYSADGKTYLCTLRKDSIDFNVVNYNVYKLGLSGGDAVGYREEASAWMDTVETDSSYYFMVRRPIYTRSREIPELQGERIWLYVSTGDTNLVSRGDTLREAYGYFYAKMITEDKWKKWCKGE